MICIYIYIPAEIISVASFFLNSLGWFFSSWKISKTWTEWWPVISHAQQWCFFFRWKRSSNVYDKMNCELLSQLYFSIKYVLFDVCFILIIMSSQLSVHMFAIFSLSSKWFHCRMGKIKSWCVFVIWYWFITQNFHEPLGVHLC